jgi:hypothetical protein
MTTSSLLQRSTSGAKHRGYRSVAGSALALVAIVLALALLSGAAAVNDAYCASRFELPPRGCPLAVVDIWSRAVEPRCGS